MGPIVDLFDNLFNGLIPFMVVAFILMILLSPLLLPNYPFDKETYPNHPFDNKICPNCHAIGETGTFCSQCGYTLRRQ